MGSREDRLIRLTASATYHYRGLGPGFARPDEDATLRKCLRLWGPNVRPYQLETDSLGGNPVLRRLKDNQEIRPLSANRNTIKAMEQRGLISPGKGRDPLTIVWRLKKKIK